MLPVQALACTNFVHTFAVTTMALAGYNLSASILETRLVCEKVTPGCEKPKIGLSAVPFSVGVIICSLWEEKRD